MTGTSIGIDWERWEVVFMTLFCQLFGATQWLLPLLTRSQDSFLRTLDK